MGLLPYDIISGDRQSLALLVPSKMEKFSSLSLYLETVVLVSKELINLLQVFALVVARARK
jgi:hypothetical protein